MSPRRPGSVVLFAPVPVTTAALSPSVLLRPGRQLAIEIVRRVGEGGEQQQLAVVRD